MVRTISRPLAICLSASLLMLGGCSVAPGLTKSEQDIRDSLSTSKYQPASRSMRDNIETQELFAQAAFWSREYELNPGDLESAIKLSSAVRRIGNPQRSLEIAQTTRALYPRDPYLIAEFAASLIAMERANEAIEPIDDGLRIAPNYARLWSLKGAALDQSENYDLARRHYARALQITPNDSNIMANVGLSYALSGDPQTAEGWLRRAVSVPGASQSVRQNLALVLQLQGKTAEAENYSTQPAQLRGSYSAAPSFAPNSVPVPTTIGQTTITPQYGNSYQYAPSSQPSATQAQTSYQTNSAASYSSAPTAQAQSYNYGSSDQLAGRNSQPLTASDAARLAAQQSARSNKVTIPLNTNADAVSSEQLSVLQQISKSLGPKSSASNLTGQYAPIAAQKTAQQQVTQPVAQSGFTGYPTPQAQAEQGGAYYGQAPAVPTRREAARSRR